MSDLDNEQNPINWLINQPVDAEYIGAGEYVPERPIRETISLMVEAANKDVPEERQILLASAFELVERSLTKTLGLSNIEQRVLIATRELQDFLSTAITGRKPVLASAYTDLLPIGHPLSTTPVEISEITRALLKSEWLSADPRISEEFRPLVASVYLTSPGSVEHNYLMSRLESADDKDVPRDVVVAITAAINPFAGGNSFLERSARAKLQRRDRLGRFAFMGGGARTFIRNLKGFIQSCVGRFVGSDPSSDTFDVEFIDDPVLGTGIYRFPSSKVSGVKAFLKNIKGLLTSKIKPKSADYARGYAVDESQLQKIDAPSGWTLDTNPVPEGAGYTRQFISNDGYILREYPNTQGIPNYDQNVSSGAGVVGLGKKKQIDPTKPVYELITNPDGGYDKEKWGDDKESKVVGYFQSWGDVQSSAQKFDKKTYKKVDAKKEKKMWGDAPDGDFPSSTFEQVNPSDENTPFSTYRTKNNAEGRGGYTVRRFQPEKHNAVSEDMKRNVAEGAEVRGLEAGSSEIDPEEPIFEITRQPAPWEKDAQPEVIGYAQDWEDVQNIAENSELSEPRGEAPRRPEVKKYKKKAALQDVHQDDIVLPTDFKQGKDGKLYYTPEDDNAMRARISKDSKGNFVADFYDNSADQKNANPSRTETYTNLDDALEGAANVITEDKSEKSQRIERRLQPVKAQQPVAPVVEEVGAEAEVYPIPDVTGQKDEDGKPLDWYVDENGIRIEEADLTDEDRKPENRRIRDGGRLLDGNGRVVDFNPEYKQESSPLSEVKTEEGEKGFWDLMQVDPEEVITDEDDVDKLFEHLYDGRMIEVSRRNAVRLSKIAKKTRGLIGPDEDAIGKSDLAREVSSEMQALPSKYRNRLLGAIDPANLNEERARKLLGILKQIRESGKELTIEDLSAIHREFRTESLTLTNIKIRGSSFWTNRNLGAVRIRMPQISTKLDEAEIQLYAKRQGISVTSGKKKVSELTPVQAEMDLAKTGAIAERVVIAHSPDHPDYEAQKKWFEEEFLKTPLFVTQDGYIIDGHHRHSAMVMAGLELNREFEMNVIVLGLDHEEALKWVNEFNDFMGIRRQSLSATPEGIKPRQKPEVEGKLGRQAAPSLFKEELEAEAKLAAEREKVHPIPDVSDVYVNSKGEVFSSKGYTVDGNKLLDKDGNLVAKKVNPSSLTWYADENGIRIREEDLTDADKTPERQRFRDLKNNMVLDGNGRFIEFNPEFRFESDPTPRKKPNHNNFWDTNEVNEEEVIKDETDPQKVYEILHDGGYVEVPIDVAVQTALVGMVDRDAIGPDQNAIGRSKLARELSSALEGLPNRQTIRLKSIINPAALNEERATALLNLLKSKNGEPLTDEEFKYVARTYRNLGVDLTNMRITGSDNYLNNNMGAERGRMPQLSTKEDQADFEATLTRLGIKFEYSTRTPDQLTPVQKEMDLGNVGKILTSWLTPSLRKKFNMDEEVLYVTRDGYVIDGHHRWASALLAQQISGEPINLKVVVVDLDFEDALRLCNEYNDYIGVTRQTLGATSADGEPTRVREVAGEIGVKGSPSLYPNGKPPQPEKLIDQPSKVPKAQAPLTPTVDKLSEVRLSPDKSRTSLDASDSLVQEAVSLGSRDRKRNRWRRGPASAPSNVKNGSYPSRDEIEMHREWEAKHEKGAKEIRSRVSSRMADKHGRKWAEKMLALQEEGEKLRKECDSLAVQIRSRALDIVAKKDPDFAAKLSYIRREFRRQYPGLSDKQYEELEKQALMNEQNTAVRGQVQSIYSGLGACLKIIESENRILAVELGDRYRKAFNLLTDPNGKLQKQKLELEDDLAIIRKEEWRKYLEEQGVEFWEGELSDVEDIFEFDNRIATDSGWVQQNEDEETKRIALEAVLATLKDMPKSEVEKIKKAASLTRSKKILLHLKNADPASGKLVGHGDRGFVLPDRDNEIHLHLSENNSEKMLDKSRRRNTRGSKPCQETSNHEVWHIVEIADPNVRQKEQLHVVSRIVSDDDSDPEVINFEGEPVGISGGSETELSYVDMHRVDYASRDYEHSPLGQYEVLTVAAESNVGSGTQTVDNQKVLDAVKSGEISAEDALLGDPSSALLLGLILESRTDLVDEQVKTGRIIMHGDRAQESVLRILQSTATEKEVDLWGDPIINTRSGGEWLQDGTWKYSPAGSKSIEVGKRIEVDSVIENPRNTPGNVLEQKIVKASYFIVDEPFYEDLEEGEEEKFELTLDVAFNGGEVNVTDKDGVSVGYMRFSLADHVYDEDRDLWEYDLDAVELNQQLERNIDPNKPFATIDYIEVNADKQRRGIATAMLELARQQSSFPIYHSSELTTQGEPFAFSVGNTDVAMVEDLDYGGEISRSNLYSGTSPVAKEVASRIKTVGEPKEEVTYEGDKVSSSIDRVSTKTVTGEYTDKKGKKWTLKFTQDAMYYRGISTANVPRRSGVISVEDPEVPQGLSAGQMLYSEPLMSYVGGKPYWYTRFVAKDVHGSVDPYQPFAVIDNIYSNNRGLGLATAMLEFARTHAGMPIYHHEERTSHGVAFSRRVGNTPITETPIEDLVDAEEIDAKGRVSDKVQDVTKRITVAENAEFRNGEQEDSFYIRRAKYVDKNGEEYELVYQKDEARGYPQYGKVDVFKDGMNIGFLVFQEVPLQPGTTDRWRVGYIAPEFQSQVDDSKPFNFIQGVSVIEPYQRLGLATAMLQFARMESDTPIYHSTLRTDAGRDFSIATGNTPSEVLESLDNTDFSEDVDDKSDPKSEIVSRVKHLNRKPYIKSVDPDSSQKEWEGTYTTKDGEVYNLNHLELSRRISDKENQITSIVKVYDPIKNKQVGYLSYSSEQVYRNSDGNPIYSSDTIAEVLMFGEPEEWATTKTEPFATIDYVQIEKGKRRKGLATAMLEFARENSNIEIRHSSMLSPSGREFARATMNNTVQMIDDLSLDEVDKVKSVKELYSPKTPKAQEVASRVNVTEPSKFEESEGNAQIWKASGEYTSADGKKFELKFGERRYYSEDGSPYSVSGGNIEAFAESGDKVGILRFSEIYRKYDEYNELAWDTGYVAEEVRNEVSKKEPSNAIDYIAVAPYSKRIGLATAMLEFARMNSERPINHSNNRTDDGLIWSSIVGNTPAVTLEELSDTDAVQEQKIYDGDSEKVKKIASRISKVGEPRIQTGEIEVDEDDRRYDPFGRPAGKFTQTLKTQEYSYTDEDGYKYKIQVITNTRVDENTGEIISQGGQSLVYFVPKGQEFSENESISKIIFHEPPYLLNGDTRKRMYSNYYVARDLHPEVDENKPFSFITNAYTADAFKRRGLATAALLAARAEFPIPIYHSSNRTGQGVQFSSVVQNTPESVVEDLSDVQKDFEEVFTYTPKSEKAREVVSRITIDQKAEIKTGNVYEDITYKYGDYTDQEGNTYRIEYKQVQDADGGSTGDINNEYYSGHVQISTSEGQVVAEMYTAEADRLIDRRRGFEVYWDVEAVASLNYSEVDNRKPFATISDIGVLEDFQRRGLATAMLEFARMNTDMPIYHSVNRTSDGIQFSRAAQMTPSDVIENLDAPDLKPADTTRIRSEVSKRVAERIVSLDDLTKTQTNKFFGMDNESTVNYALYSDPKTKIIYLIQQTNILQTISENGETLRHGYANVSETVTSNGKEYKLGVGEITPEVIAKTKSIIENRDNGRLSMEGSLEFIEARDIGENSWDSSRVAEEIHPEVSNDSPFAFILGIYVDSDHQRRGLATAMLEFSRQKFDMPIYHSYDRSDEGIAFSRAAQSTVTPEIEELDETTEPISPEKKRFPDHFKTLAERTKKAIDSNPVYKEYVEKRQSLKSKHVADFIYPLDIPPVVKNSRIAKHEMRHASKFSMFIAGNGKPYLIEHVATENNIIGEKQDIKMSGYASISSAYKEDGVTKFFADEAYPMEAMKKAITEGSMLLIDGEMNYREAREYGQTKWKVDALAPEVHKDVDPDKPFAYISGIYVDEDLQRLGIGTALLEASRMNSTMPIYHSKNRSDEGIEFSQAVRNNPTAEIEGLDSPVEDVKAAKIKAVEDRTRLTKVEVTEDGKISTGIYEDPDGNIYEIKTEEKYNGEDNVIKTTVTNARGWVCGELETIMPTPEIDEQGRYKYPTYGVAEFQESLVDPSKPFYIVDSIITFREQRQGIATAMLQFSRNQTDIPIYHSSIRTGDGDRFAAAVQNSITDTPIENIDEATPVPSNVRHLGEGRKAAEVRARIKQTSPIEVTTRKNGDSTSRASAVYTASDGRKYRLAFTEFKDTDSYIPIFFGSVKAFDIDENGEDGDSVGSMSYQDAFETDIDGKPYWNPYKVWKGIRNKVTPDSPFSTIGMIQIYSSPNAFDYTPESDGSLPRTRTGIATAMLEFARMNSVNPIYHSSNLTDDGLEFSYNVRNTPSATVESIDELGKKEGVVQNTVQEVLDDLITNEQQKLSERIVTKKTQEVIGKLSTDSPRTETYSAGDYREYETRGSYMAPSGEILDIEFNESRRIINSNIGYKEEISGKIKVSNENGKVIGVLEFSTPLDTQTGKYQSSRVSEILHPEANDDDAFAVIDWIQVVGSRRREGIATAMLEFARQNLEIPVYHSVNRSPAGLQFSRATQNTATEELEKLDDDELSPSEIEDKKLGFDTEAEVGFLVLGKALSNEEVDPAVDIEDVKIDNSDREQFFFDFLEKEGITERDIVLTRFPESYLEPWDEPRLAYEIPIIAENGGTRLSLEDLVPEGKTLFLSYEGAKNFLEKPETKEIIAKLGLGKVVLLADSEQSVPLAAKTIVKNYFESWKISPTSKDSSAIQHSVKEVFGLTDTYDLDDKKEQIIKPLPNDTPEKLKLRNTMVRAQYEYTQKKLKELGITRVIVYRGMDIEEGRKIDAISTTSIDARPLSSWSISPKVARLFAAAETSATSTRTGISPNSEDAIVLKMAVPIERIFGIPPTGVGEAVNPEGTNEAEVVLLGGRAEAKAINFKKLKAIEESTGAQVFSPVVEELESLDSDTTSAASEITSFDPADPVPSAPRNAGGMTANMWWAWERGPDGNQYTDYIRQQACRLQGLPIPETDFDEGRGSHFMLQRGWGAPSENAIKGMIKAILNSPPQPPLFRGVGSNNSEQVKTLKNAKAGDVIDMPMVSTTRSAGASVWYANDRNMFGVPVVIKIREGANGVSISKKGSFYPHDYETVVNGSFRVVSNETISTPVWNRDYAIFHINGFTSEADGRPILNGVISRELQAKIQNELETNPDSDLSQFNTDKLKFTNDRNRTKYSNGATRHPISVWQLSEPQRIQIIELEQIKPFNLVEEQSSEVRAQSGVTEEVESLDLPTLFEGSAIGKSSEDESLDGGLSSIPLSADIDKIEGDVEPSTVAGRPYELQPRYYVGDGNDYDRDPSTNEHELWLDDKKDNPHLYGDKSRVLIAGRHWTGGWKFSALHSIAIELSYEGDTQEKQYERIGMTYGSEDLLYQEIVSDPNYPEIPLEYRVEAVDSWNSQKPSDWASWSVNDEMAMARALKIWKERDPEGWANFVKTENDFVEQKLRSIKAKSGETIGEMLDKLETQIMESMQKEVKGQTIFLKMGAPRLKKFIEDGRYKSAWEIGRLNGKGSSAEIYWEHRRATEQQIGVPDGTRSPDRPIYGVVKEYYPNATEAYGGVKVSFKPEIKNRTTATIGDSIDGSSQGASWLTDIEEGKVSKEDFWRIYGQLILRVIQNRRAPEKNGYKSAFFQHEPNEYDSGFITGSIDIDLNDWSLDYIEAQIHGGVTLDDVSEIELKENSGLTKKQKDFLASKGIKVTEIPAVTPPPAKTQNTATDEIEDIDDVDLWGDPILPPREGGYWTEDGDYKYTPRGDKAKEIAKRLVDTNYSIEVTNNELFDGIYTDKNGEIYDLKLELYTGWGNKGDGVVKIFKHKGREEIGRITFYEADKIQDAYGETIWNTERIPRWYEPDNYDEYNPFAVIGLAAVHLEEERRRGLATAMLEFARKHAYMPIHHSENLSDDGKPFAKATENTVSDSVESLEDREPVVPKPSWDDEKSAIRALNDFEDNVWRNAAFEYQAKNPNNPVSFEETDEGKQLIARWEELRELAHGKKSANGLWRSEVFEAVNSKGEPVNDGSFRRPFYSYERDKDPNEFRFDDEQWAIREWYVGDSTGATLKMNENLRAGKSDSRAAKMARLVESRTTC